MKPPHFSALNLLTKEIVSRRLEIQATIAGSVETCRTMRIHMSLGGGDLATQMVFGIFVGKTNRGGTRPPGIEMKENIVGRSAEKKLLAEIESSGKPELVAITGRRRIGKTFLVEEFFSGDDRQLFRIEVPAGEAAKDWSEAFADLQKRIEASDEARKIVFLDNLPAVTDADPAFLPALAEFWNSWAGGRSDVVVIVAGAATGVMAETFCSDAHGDTHAPQPLLPATRHINLGPFSPAETKAFMRRRGFRIPKAEVDMCHQTFGGIPYYLNMLDPAISIAENINRMLQGRIWLNAGGDAPR